MPACPQCSAEVANGQRFCPQCGARQPDTTQQPAQQSDDQPTPGATIVIPPGGAPATERLDAPAAPAEPSAPTQAFGLPEPPQQQPPPGWGLPQQPPPQQPPPQQPPPGGFSLPASAPGPVGVQPPQQGGKTSWGLILGIIGGVLVLGCIVVVAGLAFIGRQVTDTIASITPETSLLATVLPDVTLEPEATAEEATAEPEATSEPALTSEFTDELLTDDFASEPASKFIETSDSDGSFSFTGGKYILTIDKQQYFMWSAAGEEYTDIAVEIDAAVEGPSDGSAAILFRYVDDQNFYILRIHGDASYSLEAYVDDEVTELVEQTDSSALNGDGQTNRIRIETEGDTIRLFANGEPLTEVADGSHSSGDVALGISAREEAGVTVTYDDLVILGK